MDPAGTHLVAVEEGVADQQVELRVGQIMKYITKVIKIWERLHGQQHKSGNLFRYFMHIFNNCSNSALACAFHLY